MELDSIDFQILRLLSENSRMQWKELGEKIHMTGQAVGNRIKRLEENGTIKAYSLLIDEMNLGLSYTAFVIIFMKTADHYSFLNFTNNQKEIIEVHRVSGEGCYHLKVKVSSQEQLNVILNKILDYGNYKLYLSIQEMKQHSPLDAT
ncbi:Lrp/AsnC family transcriptional regulator [Oceanobacillus jeddahense]|uniref:Lrp/AsnC family transcriptional regulator n=1 Tax=Oceanobacillus jeddahense TaxID=1462527 RepID=A0ABY5K2N1_9BACI|nr:Lrp/AsnC family transcriptional regulator [Oceanobacillus jeddahense]UUI05407.1 Lrp/AsnC family transcriptional regulator [Oceanobacillus jeddahense]